MIKIAVIGSREFKSVNIITKRLLRLKDEMFTLSLVNNATGLELISGGAMGVDKEVEKFAFSNKIPLEIIRPITPSDKFSYLLRNVEIITKADRIIVFWDGKSNGTRFVINYAKSRHKDIEIIMEDEKR